MLLEVYDDHAAFAAHWSGPSLAQARKELVAKLVGLSGVPFQLAGA